MLGAYFELPPSGLAATSASNVECDLRTAVSAMFDWLVESLAQDTLNKFPFVVKSSFFPLSLNDFAGHYLKYRGRGNCYICIVYSVRNTSFIYIHSKYVKHCVKTITEMLMHFLDYTENLPSGGTSWSDQCQTIFQLVLFYNER